MELDETMDKVKTQFRTVGALPVTPGHIDDTETVTEPWEPPVLEEEPEEP